MEPEVTFNWTNAVTAIHPCYEIDNSQYILTKNPSIICVLLYIFLMLLCVVTISGNLLVIISVSYFQQLHTPTNYLILSLAVADLLVGVIVFPFSMALSLSSCVYNEGVICKVRNSFDVSLCLASILNLFCISIDRYYAVCQPLTYRTKISDRVIVIMILLSWGVSVIDGVSFIITGLNNANCVGQCLIDSHKKNTIGLLLTFYIPVLIMLCVYVKIFLVAQKQARSIQNTTCQTTKSGASKTERKATKTLATVLGVFIICWTPFCLCFTFSSFTNGPAPVPVIETLNWLTLSNSMLNPFIYAFFYSWFRSAFRMIISGKLFKGDFTHSKLS